MKGSGHEEDAIEAGPAAAAERVHGTPSRGGGSHAFVPANLRGARATQARSKIKETLTDPTYESGPDLRQHLNKR